jgi:amidase
MEDLNGPAADLGFSSITEIKELLSNREISPSELVAELTHRILEIDDCENGLKSVLAINTHTEINSKTQNLPLSGIPLFIKDNIEAIGLPATAGSLALTQRQVVSDAPLVNSLKDHGAVILGSTNLSEWANLRSANSTSGWSAVGGLTANPWKFSHSAGGSSSGSGSAVAAGLIPAAIGTETDGSIVCPASLNGVVGIKPTVGKISRDRIVPISFSQDSPGPIARNVDDALKILEILTGDFDLVAASKDESKLCVGVVREWLTLDQATNDIFENQLTELAKSGIELVEIDVKPFPEQAGSDELTVLMHELKFTMDSYLANRHGEGVKSLADVISFNLENSENELKYFDQEYFELAQSTDGLSEKYHEARSRNLNWAKDSVLDPALSQVDVLIGVPYGPAWKSDLANGDDFASASWMTHAPAISGYPIASLPMGFVTGLPVGLGIVAKANEDVKLAKALRQFERVLGFKNLIPTFIR